VLSSGSTSFVSKCQLVGGTGGSGSFSTQCCQFGTIGGAGGNAARTTTAPDLVRAQECTFQGGLGGPGAGGFCGIQPGTVAPAIAGPGQVVQGFGTARNASAATLVREGQSWTLTLQGQPGEIVRLFTAATAVYAWVPAWNGVRLVPVRVPRELTVEPLVVPGSGVLTITQTVPDLAPGVLAERQFLQPLFKNANGTRTLGPTRAVVVLDSTF
jgi:hypothetical protein